MSDLSISRSVGRAFEVLEFFRGARAPRSTPEIEKALHYPYSSIRVILKSLSSLGYLEYHEGHKTYFPTEKLMSLGSWVQNALLESEPLMQLLTSVHRRLDETTAIATPNFIFCNLIRVRNGTRQMAPKLPGGIGLTLTNSASGRALLSQMSDSDVQGVLRHTQYWAGVTHSASPPDPAEVLRAVEGVRANGYITDCGGLKSGVGTVAYPVPSPFKETPIVLLVTGPAVRIKHDECKIRRAIELYVSSYRVHAQR